MGTGSVLALAVMSAAPTVGVLGRELLSLFRYRVRRRSVEQMVTMLPPGSRLVDRDSGGEQLELVVVDTLTGASAQRRSRRSVEGDV